MKRGALCEMSRIACVTLADLTSESWRGKHCRVLQRAPRIAKVRLLHECTLPLSAAAATAATAEAADVRRVQTWALRDGWTKRAPFQRTSDRCGVALRLYFLVK